MIQTKTYKNGLRLILEHNNKNVVSVSFMFAVGSGNEKKNEEGYSHFIEHMIFKGTKNISAIELMDKLTFWGADYNAYTTKTSTKFIFKCLAENFEKCFATYSDILINAEFKQDELDRERQVVIEEMKRYDDDPVAILGKRLLENYFDGLAFAHDELGSEQIIENVTREQLLEFKTKFYKAENCVISVAGNIDFEQLNNMVEKYFSCNFNYESTPKKVDFSPYKIKISKKYDIVERDDNQANVAIRIKASTSGDDDRYISGLYTSILGGSQNSKLFKIIREKLGLVYSICAYNEMSPQAGELVIMFGTRPKNLKKAMQEIKKIIIDFAKNGVDCEELERAKNWKKSCLSFGIETNSDLAEINGSILGIYNKIFDVNERVKIIESITINQVNDYAKKIANETVYNVVAVGKNLNIENLKIY